MTRMSIAVVVALALTGAIVNLRHVTAQQPVCLHGQKKPLTNLRDGRPRSTSRARSTHDRP